VIVVTEKNLKGVLKTLSGSHTLALDTETTGLRPYHGDKLFSLIIANQSTEFYFNFQDYVAEKIKGLPRAVLQSLRSLFENPAIRWRLSNAKYDMAILLQEGLELRGEIHDTQAIGRIVKNTLFNYSLDALAKIIGLEKDDKVDAYIKEHKLYQLEVDEDTGEKTKKPCYWKVPFSLISVYACNDARCTYAIADYQEAEIEKTKGALGSTRAVFENEKKLTPVLFGMERAGILVDTEYAKRALSYELKRLQNAKTDFEAFAEKALGKPVPFTDSAKCFAPVFDAVGERYPLTEKGNPSFARPALEGMSTPLAKMILSYREAQKISGTYYENFLYFADARSRIHGSIRQGGTKTGRLSAAEPNMQNLNKESVNHCGVCEADIENPAKPCPDCGANSHEAREYMVRRAFIPSPGTFFLMPDYDQMEYRLMLEYAGEMDVIRAALSSGVTPLAIPRLFIRPRFSRKI